MCLCIGGKYAIVSTPRTVYTKVRTGFNNRSFVDSVSPDEYSGRDLGSRPV